MPSNASPLPELASLLNASSEPSALLDIHHRILVTNSAYRQHAKGAGSVIGRKCFEVSHHYSSPCDQAGESCPLARCQESGKRERVVHLHHTPLGEEYVSIELTPICGVDGEIEYFLERMEVLPVARGIAASQELVGRSRAFRQMLDLLARVAKSEASVLLEGESGTGKELVANALHRASGRSSAPFIAVDCSGIPDALFESEFFGHERGAFTGAISKRVGLVEAASGGTLFLDEVGDIPLGTQVKLLRLLETGSYRHVGSTELRQADIRVVSATHRNLREMVAAGTFRADLFYRLNTFPIIVPALRERKEDIPLLVKSLLTRVAPNRQLGLTENALQYLMNYAYPGNIRELRNLLERASLMCDHQLIDIAHLPAELISSSRSTDSATLKKDGKLQEYVDESSLKAFIETHRGTRRALAEKLGISERSLYRKLKNI